MPNDPHFRNPGDNNPGVSGQASKAGQAYSVTLNINFSNLGLDGAVLRVLGGIANQVTALSQQLSQQSATMERNKQMADRTLQEIVDDVATEKTVAEGIATMVTNLLAKAAAVPGLTPEQQTQINAIADGVEANTASFQAALTAGTPAIPATPPTVDIPPVVIPTDPATGAPLTT